MSSNFSYIAQKLNEGWNSSCECPNISGEVERLLGECVAWSETCDVALNFQLGGEPDNTSSAEVLNSEDVCSFLSRVAYIGLVPPAASSLGCTADEKSASWSRRYADRLLRICLNLLSSLHGRNHLDQLTSALKQCYPHLLYFCGGHIDASNAWCTEESSQLAYQTLHVLCSICECSDTSALLASNAGKSLLQMVGERLTKETWRDHVQAVEVLFWYVGAVAAPAFEDNINRLMPALLLVVDEGEACLDLSVRSALALKRLVSNVTEAELRRYDRLAVLHEAVKRHTYCREPRFLSVILPLHILLSSMMATAQRVVSLSADSHEQGDASRLHIADLEWNSMDELFEHLLFSAACESRWDLRRVYIVNVHSVLYLMGLRAVRHLRRLAELAVNYLEFPDTPDEECRFAALAVLRRCVITLWPRLAKPEAVLKALLRLCQDLTRGSRDGSSPASGRPDEGVPVHWVQFCSGFELVGNGQLRTDLLALVSPGFGVTLAVRGFLLVAAVECLLLLCGCSEFAKTVVTSLAQDGKHAGLQACLCQVLKLAESSHSPPEG